MNAYCLGLDVGTGGSRALLVDLHGNVHSEFVVPHEAMQMERPLWAEQSPENWAAASMEAIRGVLHESQIDARGIRGIGLSGQMHGLTLLDHDARVIRPAPIWCDQRAQAQVDWINHHAGAEFVLASIANPMITGFTLPKLLWVREHEPANYRRVRHILLPKDYVRYRLTGEFATDVSDASGTGLFDVVERRWSFDLADRVDVDRRFLPNAFESTAITGRIHAEAARETGLAEGTPVVAGAGDQAASAVGNGIVEPGLVSCTIGTSGVVFAQLNSPEYDRAGRVHTFCHAVENAWHVMGVTQGAGLSLQWFRNQFAPSATYNDLMAEAAAATADGLYWLPYLMGERSPHLDSTARGGWIGITARHTRGDLIRAILEGVAFSLKDCLDLIAALGVVADSVRLSGGGARSPLWRQIFADVFGKRVTTLETQEGSAYGAALLAMAGTGAFSSVAEASKAVVREAGSMEPRAAECERYAKSHEIYKSLYPALQLFYRLL